MLEKFPCTVNAILDLVHHQIRLSEWAIVPLLLLGVICVAYSFLVAFFTEADSFALKKLVMLYNLQWMCV